MSMVSFVNTVKEFSKPRLCLISDSEVHRGVLEGHTDAVWGLVVHPSSGLLASCASDGQAFLWDPQLTSPKLRVFQPEEGKDINTLYLIVILLQIRFR